MIPTVFVERAFETADACYRSHNIAPLLNDSHARDAFKACYGLKLFSHWHNTHLRRESARKAAELQRAEEERHRRQQEFEKRERQHQQRASQRRQVRDIADSLNFGHEPTRIENRRRRYA